MLMSLSSLPDMRSHDSHLCCLARPTEDPERVYGRPFLLLPALASSFLVAYLPKHHPILARCREEECRIAYLAHVFSRAGICIIYDITPAVIFNPGSLTPPTVALVHPHPIISTCGRELKSRVLLCALSCLALRGSVDKGEEHNGGDGDEDVRQLWNRELGRTPIGFLDVEKVGCEHAPIFVTLITMWLQLFGHITVSAITRMRRSCVLTI